MKQHKNSHATLDLAELARKKGRIVSSKEALKDVRPASWSDEVLAGEKRVTVDLPKIEE